jgi:putative ABC transport system permease protein
MGFPARTPSCLRYVRFWKRDVDAEIDAELRFHFDARIEELVNQGQNARDARAQAIAEFGNVGDTREALRTIDERIAVRHARGEVLDGWRQDAVYGIRSLLRTPGVTATIIVTLALGLGMNAAMFSFLDQVFDRMPRGVLQPASIRRME